MAVKIFIDDDEIIIRVDGVIQYIDYSEDTLEKTKRSYPNAIIKDRRTTVQNVVGDNNIFTTKGNITIS